MRHTLRVLIVALAFVVSACGHVTPASGPTTKPAPAHVQKAEENPLIKLLESLGEKKDPAPLDCTGSVCRYSLKDEVDDAMADKFVQYVKDAEAAGAKDLDISIDSPGGDVDSGFKIIDALEHTKMHSTCTVTGEAASMAAAILQSCGSREIAPRGFVMFHQMTLGVRVVGREVLYTNLANMVRVLNERLAWQCAHRLTISQEEYREKVKDGRELWLTPEDALKVGAVDKIVK